MIQSNSKIRKKSRRGNFFLTGCVGFETLSIKPAVIKMNTK